MTTSKGFQPWRRLVRALEAVCIAGLPFLRVKGESALRLDIPTLRLHFFGASLWMEEFFILMVGLIFITFLFVFITVMFGRLWCGWLCPQTVLSDMTDSFERAAGSGVPAIIRSWIFVFIVCVFVAANLIWYFVSPYDFFSQLVRGRMGTITWGFWISLTGILFLNFVLVRRTFCATVCPYAKLQGALYDKDTLIIAMDPRRKQECIDCGACVRGCPVGIDIRNGLSDACVNCAECIDRCSAVMDTRQKKSLIGYFFGVDSGTGRLIRQNAVITGTAALVFLGFFLFLVFTRLPVDLTVLPNHSFAPRLSRDGSAVNSYVLSIKNRGREDREMDIAVQRVTGFVKIVPAGPFLVRANEMKKVTLYISIQQDPGKEIPPAIELTVRSEGGENLAAARKVPFHVPEGP
ncbi:MAG: 4Fe-4S binding protein [Nitrospiraceae bacterium]|nr:MAG: 4Fe-4S binding protein [Nitrospiraceae bacterium]